jgi:hypothetical protein
MKFFEGIDRIGVLLNPLFFDKKNINRHKDPYNRLTLHKAGQFYVLSIHEEWFNPFFDYQVQIALAVYELVKEGVITFPDTPFTPLYICQYHKYFILNIVALEFFSDFKHANIKLEKEMLKKTIDEAKDEGGLYQYYDKNSNKLTDTCYSPDKKGSKKSKHIVYNKLEKSIKDNNHAPIETLIKTQNPIRLEFRIYANNSKWLHWDNLKGDYQKIFNRYKEYLAVIFNNYIAGCLTIKGKENNNYKKIIKTAKSKNRERFRTKRGKLKQHDILTDEDLFLNKALSQFKLDEKKQRIIETFTGLSKKEVNITKIEIFNKTMFELNKNRENNGKIEQK